MEEIWKDIQNYEGYYQISNLGNVKSLHYGSKVNNPNWDKLPSHLLKQKVSTSGYLRVELYKQKSRKCFYVHRLVASMFIPNPLNKPEVNHIDGNKLNNCVDNLEWTTISENQIHAIKNGLRKSSPMLGKIGHLSPCSKPVIQYDLQGNFIKLWLCGSDAARNLSMSATSISLCATNKHKTANGYIWRYVTNDYIPMNIEVN